jgi:hypothetical protein
LLPGWAAPPLLKLEDGLSSTLGPILGFRMSATLERL